MGNIQQKIIPKQTLKQIYKINSSCIDSLQILEMSQKQILAHLKKVIQENPFIQFNTNNNVKETNISALDYVYSEVTLQEELYYQLHTCNKNYSEKICAFIIESLNDKGFLSYPVEEYCCMLQISEKEFRSNLSVIQSFEPVGVGAENTFDCLKLQLLEDNQDFALQIFTECQQEIIKHDYDSITRKYCVSIEEVEEAIDIIRNLNLNPCSNYSQKQDIIIFPDIRVDIKNNKLAITPIEYVTLEHNEDYFSSIQNIPHLKKYFDEASILIDNIQKRNSTLLIVANEIISLQSEYFLLNKPLKRCRQGDISNKLGIHNSTVSRCIANKYFQFNNNILPLKSLFVSKKVYDLEDPIQNSINNLIMNENYSSPYSDYELYVLLKHQGFKISRRTIAKYRQIMNIKNSLERKKEYSLTSRDF